MTLRRLSAILTGVLLLHLDLVANDLVCAQHHGPSMREAMGAMAHGAASESPARDVTGSGEAPCKTPVRTDCCQAMMSCATSVGVGSTLVDTSPAIARVAIDSIAARTPASFARAPDPPPPKV